MDIPGVPESIPRSRVVELVKSLGIDPAELVDFDLKPEALYVQVYAQRDGNRYWDGGADHVAATHRIAIPITDDAP